MSRQIEETVANTLFPHLSQQEITITGNALSTAAIVDLVNRGFHADIPQATVYDALAKYIADNLAQSNELEATPQLVRECYFSEQFRTTARVKFPAVIAEPFVSQHKTQLFEAELSINRALLPFVFQAWFNHVVNRVGGTPVTRVGVVRRRRKPKNGGDHFEAIIYPNTASNAQDTCVWFVFDSVLLPQQRQWAALLPASDSVVALPAIPHDLDMFASFPQSPLSATKPIVKSGLLQRNHATSATQSISASQPLPPLPRRMKPRQQSPQSLSQTPAPHSSQTVPNITSRTTSKDTKYIASAPSYNTALPWELLADCTLEELLIYYPNHVMNWPGLALLFTHYSHRIVGQNWSHTAAANRINESRGIEKKYSNSRLRQFLLSAVTGLISGYNPEEIRHYEALYQLVEAYKAANVGDLLQSLLQQPPSGLQGQLLPATPLHQVGAGIVGAHPVGHFAYRVQAALLAAQSGQPAPAPPVVPAQALQQGLHPMIELLADRTQTWEQRRLEQTYAHNQTAAEDRFIRPVELFGDLNRRSFRRKPDEEDGQIWEWATADQTVIEWLDEHLTREELVQHHWRDLARDAVLWLEMGFKNSDWVRLLPNAALKEFKVLDQSTEEDRKAALHAYRARARKAKQMALEARLKGVEDSKWDPKKKKGTNASSHPDNRALYLEEKERFDEWAGQQGLRKRPAKRMLDNTATDHSAPKKRRVNLTILDSPFTAPSQLFNDVGSIAEKTQVLIPVKNDLNVHPTPQLPYPFDHEWLYNMNPNDGTGWRVPRLSEGNGSVPEWWRAARMQQMVEAGIGFNLQLVTQCFDHGVDVGPNPFTPGQLFAYPGNFILDPAPSPPRMSPDNFALPFNNTERGQDISGLAFFSDDTFDPDQAFVDPALLSNEPVFDASELDAGEFFSLPGFDGTADFEITGFETFNAAVDGFENGATGVSADQFPPPGSDANSGAAPTNNGELHSSSVAGSSRRRSPRTHQTEGPRRRSPRNHSGSFS